MLGIKFNAPVEVTITFDDSDDEEIKDTEKEIATENISNIEKITNKNITQTDNQKDKETQNVDKSQHSSQHCHNKVKSPVAIKRKCESSVVATPEKSVKHTVITNTNGQTHIIVAPPTNTSPPVDETKKTQYLDDSLKTISEHLIKIMEAYQQFSALEKNADWKYFLTIRNAYFNLSYSVVVSIMLPQERDMLFVTRFLKDTLRLCKEKNTVNITNEEQIFLFYKEMLEWAKKKQKQLLEIKFVNDKEQNQINTSEKSAHKNSPINRNESDCRNTQLLDLLNRNQTKSIPDVPDISKSIPLSYCNTNIPNNLFSPNGQGNTSGPSNTSLVLPTSSCNRTVVPPISNTVTNSYPSRLTYGSANYNNVSVNMTSCTNDTLRQNHYQQVQHGLSQMTPSNQDLFQHAQGLTRVTPSVLNPYQKVQNNLSQMKHNSQNPYSHMQQGLAQTLSTGNNTLTNLTQNTIQTQFHLGNTSAGFAAQSHLREDRNGLNQGPGNLINYVPGPQATYKDYNYIQSRIDQQRQWAPIRQPPPYDACYWKNSQAQKPISTDQQLTQAAPSAQRGTPVTHCQHQVEPQQPEVTRSMSTDSGIVSPLPYLSTIDTTNSSHILEEEQPTPFITHVTSLNPKVSYNNYGQCSVCFKTTKLKCLCLEKYYCSYNCQESDWNNHSRICKTQDQLNHQKLI